MNKPADSDMVYYSELNEWYTNNAFRSFSLKYVIDRCIHYKVANKEHVVEQGKFLLACRQPHVQAYFDTRDTVKSICIDIRPETVAEAFTVMSAGRDFEFDNYIAKYFKVPEFFEAVCPVGNAPFNIQLNELVAAIKNQKAESLLNREWFMELIENIIYHEYGNYLALNGIQSVKLETRKEVLRRLMIAKEFIDDEFLSINEVADIAGRCNMSEFHFYRSFKQAFSTTPYQYILKKRLHHAKELLLKGEQSITNIALHCNFPDLFTFSKAFKRKFRISPSQLLSK
jgi:AraC family transcriptional regulator